MAALGGMVSVFLLEFGGEIEGRILPVMGPLEISDPQSVAVRDTKTKWQAEADKLRGCDYVRIEWFLGPRGGRRVQVPAIYTDPPEVRGKGRLHWRGLIVSLSVETTLENSHADVLHQCPGRPWLTRTRFYN